jgi:hypothetical protein
VYGILVLHVAVQRDLEWLDDAARRIGRHPATVRRWVQAGLLKTYRKALDRRIYVDRGQLDELLKNPPIEEG